MIPENNPAQAYAKRAFEHARVLAAAPRGSATPAEKQAADYTQAQLKSMGVDEVKLQPFIGLRSLWLFLALAFGLALVGHAAFWLLRRPAGELPALIISVLSLGLSGTLVWRKFTFRNYPLRTNLPHGTSQNVIAVIPARGETRQRVVLAAHLDSHRAVFWFATDLLVKVFAVLSLVTLYGVYLAILLYILAVVTRVEAFALAGLVLAAFHFLGWFTGVTADLGRYSPGANDNASGVGTLLALAERLKAQPAEHIETWLVFTGCEESGCDGMISLIRDYGAMLRDAWFIDLDTVGIGEVISYIHDEGNLRRQRIPRAMEELLNEVGQPYGLCPVSTPPVGAFTEGGTLWEYGFKAACLITINKASPVAPEWHRLTDTPSRLQLPALEKIHALVWELLQRLDQRSA